MSKIRSDDRLAALAHPTRSAIVEALSGSDEMSTVLLQESTAVTRYHLYHHLQKLESAGIVENHRNQGRARWWRLTGPISISSGAVPESVDLTGLPEEVANLIRRGAEVHWVEVSGSARDAIAAKKIVESSAEAWGVDLDLPFTFTPSGILLIGKPRN